jgi:predicted MFS family arabinose efflux permease
VRLPIAGFRDSFRLLATRRFGTFWIASLLSSIGTWAQQVAEPWLLLTLGASPFIIGLDSFAMDAPVWLLTLAGGALADRSDRRRIIAVFQTLQMLCPAAIVVLLLAHRIHPWMIVGLSVVVGVTDALSMPSFQSIVPSIVARDDIGRALALNSTQFSLSRILGPAIAGVLIATLGITACFVVNAASYVPFVGVALWILPRWTPARPRADAAVRGPATGALREAFQQPQTRNALFTVFVTALLCAPLLTFTPVLVQSVFRGSAVHFSAALAAFGIGGLLGGTGLLGAPKADPPRLNAIFAQALALLVVMAALNPWPWALPPILVLAGLSMTVSNISANTVVQSTAASHVLGRTVSLYMLAIRGGGALGALITGATVSLLGVQRALLIDGAIAVVLQAMLARRRR